MLESISVTQANSTTSRRELSCSFSLEGKAPKEIHTILKEILSIFLVRLRTYQHPCNYILPCSNNCKGSRTSIGLKFSISRTASPVTYICHHNYSRFTFPMCAHSWRSIFFHSLQSITHRIY
jgi:hypothetical protein